MPTVLREGAFRFFFYSNEGTEPAHIHVQRDENIAKFWLNPVRLEDAGDFKPKEIRDIERLVLKHERTILQKWNEHFSA